MAKDKRLDVLLENLGQYGILPLYCQHYQPNLETGNNVCTLQSTDKRPNCHGNIKKCELED